MTSNRGSSHWQVKVAIVTGGSSGLGFHIAAQFAHAGATVVIAARSQPSLDQAAQLLRERTGGRIETCVLDLLDGTSVERGIADVAARHGRIDVLVNNAGQSSRRAVLDTPPDEFERMLDLNLLGAVRCIRAASAHLIAVQGHVVNIASLSAKTATRFLGAYPASKFALAAYSAQLRRELADRGLHVLLVCPGPIARDDELNRVLGRRSTVDRQSAEDLARLPEEARLPGAGAKIARLKPARIAEDIVRACERRRAELVYPAKARLLFAIEQLWPAAGDWLVRRLT